MKRIERVFLLICIFCTASLSAQINEQCKRCNMNIKDQLHKASAVENDISIEFDAIECLVNYLKTANIETLKELKVTDYNSGAYTYAKTAYYLKTKAIPSPMGAYLSAFSSKEEAVKMQQKKGGDVYSWEELRERFKNSDFGALDHHHDHNGPDAHAPIGVMGDHLHHKGGLMVSLRYMHMTMEGNMSGSSTINDEAIYSDYMVAPQEMNMQMYMLGIMYAPSDRLTLMLMQNYVQNDMDLTSRMRMGGMMMNGQMMGGTMTERDFSTQSRGVGDMKVGALYGLLANNKQSLHLNSQINIPMGSIEQRDATPMNNDAKLPYQMQLGSGTYDYTLGATYKRNYTTISIGSQLMGTLRTGENSEGYRFGNQVVLNVWGAYKVNANVSISGRLQGVVEGKIEGADDELNPKMITAANTANYGNEGIRSFVGLNVSFAEGSLLHKFRLGAEVGAPFYENYNGIQMDEGMSINGGIKYNIL